MKTTSYLFLLALWLLSACQTKTNSEKPVADDNSTDNQQPNIILIMVDDMGYSDLGCYGSEIPTPNLDKLAQNGLQFTQFYNAARCCPSRAALMTGSHPHRVGMAGMTIDSDKPLKQGPFRGALIDSCLTIAEALKQAGYGTYMTGKWHVGEHKEQWPIKRGFDKYFGLISGATSFYEVLQESKHVRHFAIDSTEYRPNQPDFYATNAYNDTAIKFLNNHLKSQPNNPFFLYLAHTAPHFPIHAPEEYVKKYLGKYKANFQTIREQRFKKQLELGLFPSSLTLSPLDSFSPKLDTLSEEKINDWDRRMAVYAAMIDVLDESVGRLVAFLESKNQLDNTIIVFLSDNGGCAESVLGRGMHDPNVPIGQKGSYEAYLQPWANVSNTPFRLFKSFIHEGGIRTPFIFHWPKGTVQKKSNLIHQPAFIVDIYATLLDAAKAQPNFEGKVAIDGKSFLPLVTNVGEFTTHEHYCWEHLGSKGIRQANWKLVKAKNSPNWELYNLENDPTELNNLNQKENQKAKELETLYLAWEKKIGI